MSIKTFILSFCSFTVDFHCFKQIAVDGSSYSTKLAFLHVELPPAFVLDTRKMISLTPRELAVSVTAPPPCSLTFDSRLTYESIVTAAVSVLLMRKNGGCLGLMLMS